MLNQIKWGVLGYARIAKTSVIPAILKADNAEFYALASSDPDKRKEAVDLFGCAKTYSEYEELLNDSEIQAVYIPLPNSLHKQWALRAMEKGKHVLCEKPIALNAEECEEMMQAAERNGVFLMEAFMYRYTDRIRKVNEIIDSGEIGAVRFIHSTFRFLLNRPNTIKMRPELGGGSLYDVGCYPVNFVGMIMKQIPESCVVQSVAEQGVDVMFSGLLKYSDGVIATINSGFNAFNQMHSEVVGTEGRIDIPDTFLGIKGTIAVTTDKGSRQIEVDESDRYALEVTDFSDSILCHREPLFSMRETYRNMLVMDMLNQAMSGAK